MNGAATLIAGVLGACWWADPLAGAQPASSEVPRPLTGVWKVVEVAGDDPAYLEVPNAAALIGHEIVITPRRISLWSVYSGLSERYAVRSETLSDMMGTSGSLGSTQAFPKDNELLTFFNFTLDPCESHHKKLDGCPLVSFAVDPANSVVYLVTFPFGLARLERVADATRSDSPSP